MKSVNEIRALLTTNDIEILLLCDRFLDQKMMAEESRGQSAERKANVILTTVGASAAFLVFFAKRAVFEIDNSHAWAILIYAASILWLARSVWYAVKTMRLGKRYRVTPDTVLEMQIMSRADALREVIAGKLWEIERSVMPNTERLFYVQRAQRALVIFGGLLLVFGGGRLATDHFQLNTGVCGFSVIGTVVVIFFLFGDAIIESAGIWTRKRK